MSELKLNKDKLYKKLYEDDFLSSMVHSGEIIIVKKNSFSLALHKSTGTFIMSEFIDKDSECSRKYIMTLDSGDFSYTIGDGPAKGMVNGVSKFRDLVLLFERVLQGTEMVKKEDNIAQFRKSTAVVLSILYRNFPNPVDIDTFYIEGKNVKKGKRILDNYDDEISIWNKNGNTSQNNPVKDAIVVYKNTIKFLYDEGYIRCSEPDLGADQRRFDDCVLTSKGLAALGKIDVERKVSWGDKINAALKDGKYKVIQDIAQRFILEVLLP